CLDNPASMFDDESIGDCAVFAESTGGADLIGSHQARVACDVSRQHGCQPTFDPRLGHWNNPILCNTGLSLGAGSGLCPLCSQHPLRAKTSPGCSLLWATY